MNLNKLISNKKEEIISKEVKERDNYNCKLCGSKEKLHVHHIKLRRNGGTWNLNNLITWCSKCHVDYHKKHKHKIALIVNLKTKLKIDNNISIIIEPPKAKRWKVGDELDASFNEHGALVYTKVRG